MKPIRLKLDKREYKFIFGLGLLGELLEELDFNLEELMQKLEKNPFKYYPFVMFTAAKYYCELEDEEIDFTLLSITDAIDKEGAFSDRNKPMIKFIKLFKDSIFKDVPNDIEVIDPEEVKSGEVEKK